MKKRLLFTFLLSMFILPVIAQVTRLSDNTSYDLGFALTDTKILLRSGITKTIWVYDIPGNSFTELSSTVTVEPDASYGLMNGKLYFAGKTVAEGIELWSTDGTPGGTGIVKNINAGAADSEPKDGFVVYNNELYFSANDGTSGRELWKTNGTDAGTARVKDINPGIGDAFTAGIPATHFGLVNGVLVFTASSSITPPVPPPGDVPDRELWKTDGTEIGTSLLKDIYLGPNPSYISSFTAYDNNTLLFSAFDPTFGDALWRTDGTVGGTVIVKDFDPNPPLPPPFYFMMPSITASFFNFQSKLYFTANDGTNGFELWVTDATTGGTSLVKNINPGLSDAFPFGFSFLSLAVKNTNKFFFAATTDAEGQELWESDGTGPGTMLLKDIVPGLGEGSDVLTIPNFLTGGLFQGNKFFVFATTPLDGTELWVSDGTAVGTQMVKDIYPGTNDGITAGSFLFYTDDKAYLITGNDGLHGEELWQTDGTGTGTVMVQDVNITPTIAANSDMQFATIASNKLYMFGTDGNSAETDFFRVDAPLTALPLRWISFDARPSNDDVLLTWETAEEEQTDYFIVQRSADGRTYFDLGRVNAHGIGSNQYSFSDLNAMRTTGVKKWFYRVKYVDKDAKSALSRTATIALNKLIASILILPNPVVNELKLAIESVNSGAGTLSVINMEGKTVLQKSINIHRGKTIVVTDASELPNGAYLLQVTTSRDGANSAERFLIQR